MVRSCVFPNCSNKMRRSASLSFHRLPLGNIDLLKLWLIVLQKDVNTPIQKLRVADYRVCSAHFSEDDYSQTNRKKNATPKHLFLKKTAIPKAETPAADRLEASSKEENPPTPVTTCSTVKKNSWSKGNRFRSIGTKNKTIKKLPPSFAVRRPLIPQGSNDFRSHEVLVNTQCLLELFQFCRFCKKECCITIEGHEGLFAVTQDCQSCGYHRDWKSHAPSAKPTQTFHNEEEYALKHEQDEEDDDEVLAQTVSSDHECSENVFIEKDGSYLCRNDETTSVQEEEVKKRMSENEASLDEWEQRSCEQDLDLDSDEDPLTVLKEGSEGKLLVWCTECENEALRSCSLLEHEKLFCCVQCGTADNLQPSNLEKLPVQFDDIISFQIHAEQEHGVKPSFILCQECGKLVQAQAEHECEHKI